MNANHKKLALRRQSIRTLTDSELRIAHGGGPSVVRYPARTGRVSRCTTRVPTHRGALFSTCRTAAYSTRRAAVSIRREAVSTSRRAARRSR
jgi:hypothetical protein